MGASAAQIAANERKELKAIIEAEFTTVGGELRIQANILAAEAEQKVRDKYAADLKVARAATVKLQKLADEFTTKAKLVVAELAETGIVAGGGSRSYSTPEPYSVTVNSEWTPKNLPTDIQNARQQVMSKLEQAMTQLTQRKLQTLKHLAITGLVSQESRDFLSQIPKAEDFIQVLDAPISSLALNQ